MAQSVKNLPAMQETWVQTLGREDPPEKGTVTHSSILAWRIPWKEETVHGVSKSQTRLSDLLRLSAPNAGRLDWIPRQGTRSHMLQQRF